MLERLPWLSGNLPVVPTDRGGVVAAEKPMREGGAVARIAVIPGDGIGKEVTPEAIKAIQCVVSSARRQIEFVEIDWGADRFLREGVALPDGAVEMLANEFDAIL